VLSAERTLLSTAHILYLQYYDCYYQRERERDREVKQRKNENQRKRIKHSLKKNTRSTHTHITSHHIMSVCLTRIGSNNDVEQQTSRLPKSDRITITITTTETETTTGSSTLISSVEQNNEDNDDDGDDGDDDDDDFFESLRKSQSKKEDFIEEEGVSCHHHHHHHSMVDDEIIDEITTPLTIKPSIATIATATTTATVTPEDNNNNVVSSTISDDASAEDGISKNLYSTSTSTSTDDYDRVDDDDDYIESPYPILESVVSSDSQNTAQSSLSVEVEVSTISPRSSVPTLRSESLMSIVDSTTTSTTTASTTTDHSNIRALIKTTTSTTTTSKATTRRKYIIPLLVIVFFGTVGWFSYQEIYSGNTSTTFTTNEFVVNRIGQTKGLKFPTERSQQDLNSNEVEQQQQQQLKVQQEIIESDQKLKRLIQENNGQNEKGIDRNNTFASREEKEKLKRSSSLGKHSRYRLTKIEKQQEQGNMKGEQMLAMTVQKPVLSSSALEKKFQQQQHSQKHSQKQTTYHQTNKKQRRRSLTLQKLHRFFVRLSFMLQLFLMRIQIIIYKTGKLIGIEIKQLSGVTDQLATHARERALLAAQHVNNVANELASTNAKIYANSHMKSGGRESIIYVGKKLLNRLTRIMSRRIDNTIHFISPTQKRKMWKASTVSPI
jgi:hypothetical protein